MPRPEFENQTSISATTSKSISWSQQSSVLPLAPSTYDKITILSPPNTVSTIMNMQMKWGAISGQTTGRREMILNTNLDVSTGLGVFYMENVGNYADDFFYDQSHMKSGSDRSGTGINTYPSIDSINEIVRKIKFDDTTGISFSFRHTHTLSSGTAERKVILFVEREVVNS